MSTGLGQDISNRQETCRNLRIQSVASTPVGYTKVA